jgi:hypothetical protein
MTPASYTGKAAENWRSAPERYAMALKSTIFKAALQVADIDHGYYADHALTLARHPSETDERMMIRLAALALNAHQLQSVCNGDGTLGFGAGLSDPDDPDVCCATSRARRACGSKSASPRTSPSSRPAARPTR